MDSMFWLFKQLVGVVLAIAGIGLALWVIVLLFFGSLKLIDSINQAVSRHTGKRAAKAEAIRRRKLGY